MENSPRKHSLTYEGNITDDLRSFLCTTLRQSTIDNIPTAKRVSKLITFALELLDNAQRYSSNGEVEFDWYVEGTKLRISVTNISNEANVNRLQSAIAHVKALSHEEVVEEYRKKMLDLEFNEKGGAGLGILQMVKQGAKDIRLDLQRMENNGIRCSSTVTAEIM